MSKSPFSHKQVSDMTYEELLHELTLCEDRLDEPGLGNKDRRSIEKLCKEIEDTLDAMAFDGDTDDESNY